MHAVVIGAGALGRLYGVQLATAGVRTSFLVRGARLAETAPFVVEPLHHPERRNVLNAPKRLADVPADADLLLLCIRAEQVVPELEMRIARAKGVPTVALTPLLPHTLQHLDTVLGRRIVVGLPAVASRLDPDGVVRYWVPPLSRTSFDSEGAEHAAVRELVEALGRAGLPARFEARIRDKNPATTILFFPLSVALAIAGSAARLVADRDLVSAGIAGCREVEPLARRIGPIEPAVRLLIAGATPRMLGLVVGVANQLAPEGIAFLEDHFGHKLTAQHQALGREILELGRDATLAFPKLEQLLSRLADKS